jgi:hypothetical protein
VIAHQTVGQHLNIKFAAVVGKPGQVDSAILIVEEHVFAAVAALGDVVRDATENGSGLSWHAAQLSSFELKGSVPFFRNACPPDLRGRRCFDHRSSLTFCLG